MLSIEPTIRDLVRPMAESIDRFTRTAGSRFSNGAKGFLLLTGSVSVSAATATDCSIDSDNPKERGSDTELESIDPIKVRRFETRGVSSKSAFEVCEIADRMNRFE